MLPELIADDALELAITMSGGVFRELNRIMREALDEALYHERAKVTIADVEKGVGEIRSEYRRILIHSQLDILQQVYTTNLIEEIEDKEMVGLLLQILAILEYTNGENWFDVHPLLISWLEERELNGR